MARNRNTWRFSLRIVEGENAGLGVGSFRIWTARNDIYVTSKDLASTLKVSLHASGKWRVAYTEEHMRSPSPLWPQESDRATHKFRAPPFVEGIQTAFIVAAQRSSLRPYRPSDKEAVVAVEDRWDILTGVKIMVTKPAIPFPSTEDLVYDEPLTLSNRNRAWLIRFVEEFPGGVPETVPNGQLLRILTPEADGVTWPGLLLQGLHIDRSA